MEQKLDLTKMQLLKIILLLSVFVLSPAIATSKYATMADFSLISVLRGVSTSLDLTERKFFFCQDHLAIRPVARKGYGSIAHEAKPNGLLIRGP